MKSTRNVLLQRMAAIETMERGKLCAMRGGRYHNLQSWEDGRNRVRYVPASEVEAVRQAVAGYRTFMELARQYADLVVRDTRQTVTGARSEPGNAKGRRI